VGTFQKGGDCRSPGAVRGCGVFQRSLPVTRHPCDCRLFLCLSDLLRFFRLLGYRNRRCGRTWNQVDGELSLAISGEISAGVLEWALASVIDAMVPRLSLRSDGRQQGVQAALVCQPDERFSAQRALPSSQLDLRRLGPTQWILSGPLLRPERGARAPCGYYARLAELGRASWRDIVMLAAVVLLQMR